MKKNYSRNTLIIGAGAHAPYGFPTGKHLREDILSLGCKNVARTSNEVQISSGDFRKLLCALFPAKELVSHDDNKIKLERTLNDFCDLFRRSAEPTIDSFLTRHIDKKTGVEGLTYPILGKTIVSYIIYKYFSHINNNNHKRDWIEHLFDVYFKTDRDVETFFNPAPKIITFNYDTYLETRIYDRLRISHHFDDIKAREYIEALSIEHIYGKMPYSFGNKVLEDKEIIEESIRTLKVVGEERNGKDELSNKIATCIYKSKNIYFLGFGFDEDNTAFLFKDIADNASNKFFFYSTNIGLGLNKRNNINEFVPRPVNINFSHFGEGKTEIHCTDLLDIKPLDDEGVDAGSLLR